MYGNCMTESQTMANTLTFLTPQDKLKYIKIYSNYLQFKRLLGQMGNMCGYVYGQIEGMQ